MLCVEGGEHQQDEKRPTSSRLSHIEKEGMKDRVSTNNLSFCLLKDGSSLYCDCALDLWAKTYVYILYFITVWN